MTPPAEMFTKKLFFPDSVLVKATNESAYNLRQHLFYQYCLFVLLAHSDFMLNGQFNI